tara:strand:- start:677 stop:865 length:189 start_codon:yes stop_codon:yes gene_type:complete
MVGYCVVNGTYSHTWEVSTIFSVSAVSGNKILTECDVKCKVCGLKIYVVSSGDIFIDGEVIE